jgi:hypothetical protein
VMWGTTKGDVFERFCVCRSQRRKTARARPLLLERADADADADADAPIARTFFFETCGPALTIPNFLTSIVLIALSVT